MQFYNRTKQTATVEVFRQDDLAPVVPMWSVNLEPSATRVYKPSTGNTARYKAKVTITPTIFTSKTEWITELGDSGQWVHINGPGPTFSLSAGVDTRDTNARPDPLVDWMTRRQARLSAWDLRRVLVPGTHDSGSFSADMTSFARTQDVDFMGQLRAGVRYFDLRITWSQKSDTYGMAPDTFYLCHNRVTARDLELRPQLDHVRQFASQHPREVIILNVWKTLTGIAPSDPSGKGTMAPEIRKRVADLFADTFKGMLVTPPSNDQTTSLLLSDIWESGRNVLVIFDADDTFSDRFWSNNAHLKNLWRSNPSGYVGSAVMQSTPQVTGNAWVADVDGPGIMTYLSEKLADLASEKTSAKAGHGLEDHFTVINAVAWGPDIRSTAAPMRTLTLSAVQNWVRDDVRRPFVNVILTDFVAGSDMVERLLRIQDALPAPAS